MSPVPALTFSASQRNPLAPAAALTGADRVAYDRLGEILFDMYHPEGSPELYYLQQVHDVDWRLQRLASIENSLHSLGAFRNLEKAAEIEPQSDLAQSLAAAFTYREDAALFEQISRQTGRMVRIRATLVNSLTNLIVARKRRQREAQEHHHCSAERAPQPVAESAPPPALEIPVDPPADFFPGDPARERLWQQCIYLGTAEYYLESHPLDAELDAELAAPTRRAA